MSAAHLLVLLALSVAAICGSARDTTWVAYGGGHEEVSVSLQQIRHELLEREAVAPGGHPLGFDSDLRKLLQDAPAEGGSTNALFAAALVGDLATVQQEIGKGSDVNAKSNGVSPLGAAVAGQHFEVMKALIAAGADSKATSQVGQLIHMAAMIPNNAKGLTILLDAGANPNAVAAEVMTPLLGAVSMGRKSNIEALLARGATFDRAAVDAFMCACLNFVSVPQSCNVQRCQNDKASLVALFD
ncbi:hypothetical protein BSKO_05254 [Bryopsis sp. KO-2023]|nr:hypothetical protein BSKO_05254 [Bryopsis sp. KO-2023]